MQVPIIVSDILASLSPQMHLRRRRALGAAVCSALAGHALSVTTLGRGSPGQAREKHRIKRLDRVLSNHHLHSERMALYRAGARRVIGACSNPVIAVDWSDLDGAQRHFLLRASVVVQGRALTLYEEVHGLSSKDKRCTQGRFLQQLQHVLPEHACPTILTDAGFRTPWFNQVRALGWHFIGRVRNLRPVRAGHH